jgi:hypothetical protein
MREEDINIDTSIQYGRILYKRNRSTVYAVIIDCLFCLVFPVISICLFFGIIKRHTPDPFLDTFFLIMGLWLLLGWYLKGKLICIEGAGSGDNKKAVIESLMLHFPNTKNITGTKKIKSGIQITRWSGVKEIVVLFDGKNAYINRSTCGEYGRKSLAFNAPLHYISLLRFRKAFKNRTKI